RGRVRGGGGARCGGAGWDRSGGGAGAAAGGCRWREVNNRQQTTERVYAPVMTGVLVRTALDGWKLFDDPRFELTLRYPDPTPQGRPAQVFEHPQDDGMAVHILSAERELYVEVARFPPIGADEEYRRHRVTLEERFGTGAVTPLRAATLGS